MDKYWSNLQGKWLGVTSLTKNEELIPGRCEMLILSINVDIESISL